MKRWAPAFGLVLLFAIWIVASFDRGPGLLNDSDTRVMITRIEQRGNPLSWWTGDWPLENHFYRPVVASLFELDRALWGWNASGYAFTNALLCALCVLALFWLLRELFDAPLWAAGPACLWAVWHLSLPVDLSLFGWVFVGLVVLVGILPGRSWKSGLGLAGIGLILAVEAGAQFPFRGGMIGWIPGRTASAMALFCLLSLASYARYERLSAVRVLATPSPQDPPATRNTVVSEKGLGWPWAVVSVAFAWLAFSSYEQAIMLPACLLGAAVVLSLSGYRVRWGWQAAFWSLLPAYWLVRKAFLPETSSAYQRQQFRNGPDVWFTIGDYGFPPLRSIPSVASTFEYGPFAVLPRWLDFLLLAAWVALGVALLVGLRRRQGTTIKAAGAWALSLVAFLPMAWLKAFPAYNHYHYWPSAFRAVFAIGLLVMAWERLTIAWPRRVPEGPRRLSPAPGSLPRP